MFRSEERLSLTLLTSCGLAIAAISMSLIGPSLPFIGEELKLSLSWRGAIAGAWSLGLVFTVFAGVLRDRYGEIHALVVSLVIQSVCVALVSVSTAPILIFALLGCVGVGEGFYEASLNPLISRLYPRNRAFALNIVRVFWGLGTFIGPSLASLVILGFGSWRLAYRITALLYIPLIVYALAVYALRYARHSVEESNQMHGETKVSLRTSLWSWPLIPLCIASFFFFSTQHGTNGWLASFLIFEKGFDLFNAGLAVSIFGGSIALGRIVLGWLPDRVGYRKTITLVAALASICCTAAIWSDSYFSTMVFWAASGFFIAPVLPTLLAWATGLFPERAGFAAGMVLSLGVLGGIFSPWLIGLIAEAFSLGKGILLLAFSAFMIAIVIFFIKEKVAPKNGL